MNNYSSYARPLAQITVLIVSALLLWYASPFKLLLEPVLDKISASTIRKEVKSTEWKEYQNDKMGITLQIPSNWQAREVIDPNPLQDYLVIIDTDKYGSVLRISMSKARKIQFDPTKDMVDINGVKFRKTGNAYTYLGADKTIGFTPIAFIGYRDGYKKSQQELYNIADQIIQSAQVIH